MKHCASLTFMMVGFTSPALAILAALAPQLALAKPLDSSPSSSGTASSLASTTTTSYREIFTVPTEAQNGATLLPNVKDPQAVNVQDVCPGYTASDVTTTATGFTASLNIAGPACNVYGNDIANLTLVVAYQAKDRVSVQITPKFIGAENETWFILPEEIIPRPGIDDKCAASHSDLEVTWSNDPTFSFTVTRKATSDVLFTTKGSKLVYADQYIEFASSLPENYNLYGLGEVIHGFRLGNNLTRTLFAADVGDPIDENIYSVHPIYHDTRYFTKDPTSGNLTYVANATDVSEEYVSYTHGVFNRNAHAQEVLLRERNITWRALGGNIDLFFYSGPNAETLVQSYQRTTVGYPAMQQYWTLGYHQCRWGYQNWTVLQDVIDNFKKFNIPLETIWTDIDYMNQYRDWENDQRTFGYKEGVEFLSNLHKNHQHYVPIVDSAIYIPNPENASDAYPIYDRGVEADAFLFDAEGDTYIGSVWPGYTVYPDWVGAVLNVSRTFEWWANEMVEYHKNIAYDGIWIDMSEVSSFCVGPCGKHNLTLNPVHPPFSLPGEEGNLVLDYPEAFNVTNATEWTSVLSASSTQANPPPTGTVSSSSSSSSSSSTSSSTSYLRTTPTPGVRNLNYPPYTINNVQGDLAVHAVSPNASHHGATLEYDFHNLNGHLILNATYHGLLTVYNATRPFIIGRSTFAGSGKWAGHWGGDNASKWAYMFFSIPQALSFSLFGIPMFGVDTCGFNGNSDMELCNRWMQLSAFFPFYRNHNVLAALPQEPYVWASVADATRKAMDVRYHLLPYMYTLFAKANSRGETVMRALAWEFPNEPWLAGADRQFLLGPAILVTPVLVQGAESVDGVFPGSGSGSGEVWYDWYNQTVVNEGVKAGENVTIEAPLGHIPVYIRGGHVLPLQQPGMTTYESRRNPWSVVAALDKAGKASGSLYLDDGESLVPENTTWVEFSATSSSLTATVNGTFADANPLANVTVLGVHSAPTVVKLGGTSLEKASWAYSAASAVLSITGLGAATNGGAYNSNWNITWA